MTTTPKIKKSKYSGVKVSNTLRGLKIKSINKLLNIEEKIVLVLLIITITHISLLREKRCVIFGSCIGTLF